MNVFGAWIILPLRRGMMLLCISSIVTYGVSDITSSSLDISRDLPALASYISSRTTLHYDLKLFT